MKKINTFYATVLGLVAVGLVGAPSAFAQATDPVALATSEVTGKAADLAGLIAVGIAGVATIALVWAAMRVVPKVIKRFS